MQTIATNTYNKVVIIKKGNLQTPFLQQQQQQQLQQQQEQQKIQPGIDKIAIANKPKSFFFISTSTFFYFVSIKF